MVRSSVHAEVGAPASNAWGRRDHWLSRTFHQTAQLLPQTAAPESRARQGIRSIVDSPAPFMKVKAPMVGGPPPARSNVEESAFYRHPISALNRSRWTDVLKQSLAEHKIVWLGGPRGTGKAAILAAQHSLYIDCESKEIIAGEDPAKLFENVSAPVVVIAEVHRAQYAARLLSAALASKASRFVITSSSWPAPPPGLLPENADVHEMAPLRTDELPDMRISTLRRRLHQGGLPTAFLSPSFPHDYFARWFETFLMRDFLWHYECRTVAALHRFILRLCGHSGSLLKEALQSVEGRDADATFKNRILASRSPAKEWLSALEETRLVTFVPPFGRASAKETAEWRKFYVFDTGLISYAKGWDNINDIDCDLLWKHLVLSQLRTCHPGATISYWEDAEHGYTIDFVLKTKGGTSIVAYDCRWNCRGYDSSSLEAFNRMVPGSESVVLCPPSADGSPRKGTRHYKAVSPAELLSNVTKRTTESVAFRVCPSVNPQPPTPKNIGGGQSGASGLDAIIDRLDME